MSARLSMTRATASAGTASIPGAAPRRAMLRARLPLILSATALVVSLLGSTPLGQAAARAVEQVVPRAKTANFAVNAGKLNGRRSSPNPKPGQIPVVGADGKLAASVGAVGPAGPPGPPGASGYQQVSESRAAPSGEDEIRAYEVPDAGCPSGKSVIAGGYSISRQGREHLSVLESRPVSNSRWRFRVRNFTGQQAGAIDFFAICANFAS